MQAAATVDRIWGHMSAIKSKRESFFLTCNLEWLVKIGVVEKEQDKEIKSQQKSLIKPECRRANRL